MKRQQLITPVFDGHFWVERHNKVIDPHFGHYNMVAMVRGVANKKNYRPAPDDVQRHFVHVFEQFWLMIREHYHTVQVNMCPYNAFLEAERNGGTVVFGSMGFGKGKNIFWEHGNPSWKKVEKFLKS